MSTFDIVAILTFTLLAVLLSGPAMWSDNPDPLIVTLWRRMRGLPSRRNEGAPGPKSAASKVPELPELEEKKPQPAETQAPPVSADPKERT
ncbi:MAG: hypothetical protein JST92_09910 [Deltaproteobacteria bacterium]|nr:hypothetical protein [Deltaproteobacteria bacterium]